MQKQKLQVLYNNPASLYREVAMLYSLGLQEDEVQYILYKKVKQQARKKWRDEDY